MDTAKRNDAGFTLTELIMYMVILIVVMGIGAALFIRIIVGQNEVRDVAEANNQAQVVLKELEMDLRNASWVTVGQSGDLLVAQTRVADGPDSSVSQCVGYFHDGSDDTLHVTRSAADTAAVLAAVDASGVRSAASGWPRSLAGMSAIDTRVFDVADGTYTWPSVVSVALSAETGSDHKPVELAKTIGLRQQSGLGTACS